MSIGALTRLWKKASSMTEIWLRGESVASGYWGLPDESTRAFGASTLLLEADTHSSGDTPRPTSVCTLATQCK